jgi:hypothetical protein
MRDFTALIRGFNAGRVIVAEEDERNIYRINNNGL